MLLVLLFLFAAPPDFNQQLRAGLVALNNNDLTHARQALEAAAKIQPQNPDVWIALAQTYRKLDARNLAQSAATKAEQFVASHPASMHALAVYYSQAGNVEKAANLESRYALTDESASADAAALWMQAGKPKAAVAYAQRALARDDRAELHALLAAAYDADGKFPDAVNEYERAIKMSPYEEGNYCDLANAYMRHQQFKSAIDVIERGRNIFDKSAQIELTLGVALYGERRFADATDAFLRTIDLDPSVERAYVFLSKMLDVVGERMPDVQNRFAQWSAANPKNATAKLVYAKALLASGTDDAKAATLLRSAIALKPEDWDSHYELGVLLERQHNYAEAADELERSIALNASQADAHYHLARVFDRLGQTDRAAAERQLHARLSAGAGIK